MSCWMRWITGLLVMVLSFSRNSSCRRGGGLQRQGMKLFTHPPFQRLIDHLMLLHPRFAGEAGGNDSGGIMIAIAAQILDRHLGVGNSLLNQALDFARIHRHAAILASRHPSSGEGSPHGPLPAC